MNEVWDHFVKSSANTVSLQAAQQVTKSTHSLEDCIRDILSLCDNLAETEVGQTINLHQNCVCTVLPKPSHLTCMYALLMLILISILDQFFWEG